MGRVLLSLVVAWLAASPLPAADLVVSNRYENFGPQENVRGVPVTFSRVGAAGDFAAGVTPRISGRTLPAQVDVLRRAPDGSIRHALVSFVLPRLPAGGALEIDWLDQEPAAPKPFVWAVEKGSLDLKLEFETEDGRRLVSDVGPILRDSPRSSPRAPLLYDGPVMKELEIHDTPVDAAGRPDDRLEIFWRLRFFTGIKSVRVEAVVENCKDRRKGHKHPVQYPIERVALRHGKKILFDEGPLDHLDQTRYRIVVWTDGPAEQIHRRPNYDYWARGKFVPRYRWTQPAGPVEVDVMYTTPREGRRRPTRDQGILESGIIHEHMPGTGGRWDIGPYPAWAVAYLLSGAPKTYGAILHADGNGGGAFPIHVRQNGRPGYNVFTVDQPPLDRGYRVPLYTLPDGSRTPTKPDHAHAPSIGYIAYLMTGDKFYAEEMSFWASYQAGEWPHQGLDPAQTERAQAWGLRHVVDAAFILPDDQPLMPYFEHCVNKYLDKFTREHVNSQKRVHYLRSQFRISGRTDWVNAGRGSTWQYAWLVWSLGNAADKDFQKAEAVRDWAAQYIVGFYTSDDEFAAPDGRTYRFDPRDAMSYNTAVELLETEVVTRPDGKRSIKVLGKIRDLSNYGEIWYYTKLNEDNAYVFGQGPTTSPDADGNWPLRRDGWGHGRVWSPTKGTTSRGYGWHRYGAWVGMVAAVDAQVPNADQAWQTMTKLAGPPEYGFEMVPRNRAISP